MGKARHKVVPAAELLLVKDWKLLLWLRQNTWAYDGMRWLISWHVEEWETYTDAAIREASEEAGIVIQLEDLSLAHICHIKSDINHSERIHVFFFCDSRAGSMVNNEDHRCVEWRWFPVNELPEHTIPFIKDAVQFSLNNVLYSEWGWNAKIEN